MHDRIVSPSVLSLDYSRMEQQIAQLNQSRAEWIHFDVMDGHFTPNLTFGPDILKGYKKSARALLDVHLMVSDPAFFAPIFARAGADIITFHSEALDNDPKAMIALIQQLQDMGVKAGFTLKPATPIEQFEEVLPYCDLVLVMSVVPGFSGQSFMEDQLEKVRWLAGKREEKQLDYRIEIDGGISSRTYQKAVDAGADTLVAGSFVFAGEIVPAVEELLA